jgi:hypothetical protein
MNATSSGCLDCSALLDCCNSRSSGSLRVADRLESWVVDPLRWSGRDRSAPIAVALGRLAVARMKTFAHRGDSCSDVCCGWGSGSSVALRRGGITERRRLPPFSQSGMLEASVARSILVAANSSIPVAGVDAVH